MRKLFFFGFLWLTHALCPAADWYVHPAGSSSPDGSMNHPFASIQQALDAAQSGDRIILLPGVYSGPGNFNLNPQGKSLTIESTEPANLEIAASTIIDPNGWGRGFVLNHPDSSPFVLQGLTIRNAVCSQEDNPPHGAALSCSGVSLTVRFCIFESCDADGGWGGAFYGENSEAIFEHCLFTANQGRYGGAAAVNLNSFVSFNYCTIVGNQAWFGGGGIMVDFDSTISLRNSIVFSNGITVSPDDRGRQIRIRSSALSASYSCLSNQPADIQADDDSTVFIGPGILYQEPEFAFYSDSIPPQMRDFRLKSRYGRWNPQTQSWILDPVTSPCINAGDPNDDWSAEPWPNGKRADIGFYGGTAQASLYGNPADFTVDGAVNLADLSEWVENWLSSHFSAIYDLNKDSQINLLDFESLSRWWLEQD
ncbi:MAG: right-handed parallel beta-helix repeat-containing protein [Anaerohalosphaeraceae bacterium]